MRGPYTSALVCLSLFFTVGASGSRADELATVTGFLTDPKGFRVPMAKVQVRNIEANVSYSSETNEEVFYSISGISAGTCGILIQKAGFKTMAKQGVDLRIRELSLPLGLRWKLNSSRERLWTAPLRILSLYDGKRERSFFLGRLCLTAAQFEL